MAEQFAPIALAAVPKMVNNYEKAWHPVKRQAKNRFGKSKTGADQGNYDDQNNYNQNNYNQNNYRQNNYDQNNPSPNDYDDYDDRRSQMRSPEERGLVLKPRREVLSDEEIVELAPRANNQIAQRPGGSMIRRASSWDDNHNHTSSRGRGSSRKERDYYDSESSISPRRRTGGRGRGSSRAGASKRSSSSSSSSIPSSTEDEKERKKMYRKKWLTTGLAGVATIHAASKVYSSLERRDKRTLELAKGTITPEEAQKKKKEGRWQDAAAVGIAALGIKGAMAEWHEAQEEREEYVKKREEQKERHERRLRRIQHAKERGVEPNIGHRRSKSTRG